MAICIRRRISNIDYEIERRWLTLAYFLQWPLLKDAYAAEQTWQRLPNVQTTPWFRAFRGYAKDNYRVPDWLLVVPQPYQPSKRALRSPHRPGALLTDGEGASQC